MTEPEQERTDRPEQKRISRAGATMSGLTIKKMVIAAHDRFSDDFDLLTEADILAIDHVVSRFLEDM